MPTINIKEELIKSLSIAGADSNTVFVPLVDDSTTSADGVDLVLYSTPSEYTGSDKYVSKLLEIGLPVLVGAAREVTTFSTWLAKADCPLLSKRLYNYRFLTIGLVEDTDMTLSKLLVTIAEARGDCIALLSCKETDTTVDAIQTTFESIQSEYAAGFAPWVKFIWDTENSYPPTLAYLLAYGKSIRQNPVWYAAAGTTRGVISEISSLAVEFGEVETNELQPETGTAICPICVIGKSGIVVWGNRTLYNATEALDAKSFLNIRNLLCTLKKVLFEACTKLTFEQNTDILWTNFRALVTPTLDRMQSGNGILGYKLLKQATTKKATMTATLQIIPVEAVEDFEITIQMTDSLEATITSNV